MLELLFILPVAAVYLPRFSGVIFFNLAGIFHAYFQILGSSPPPPTPKYMYAHVLVEHQVEENTNYYCSLSTVKVFYSYI